MGGFLFYQFDDEVTTIEYCEINSNIVTAGYINKNECNLIGIDSEIRNGYSVDLFDSQTVISINNFDFAFKILISKNLFVVCDFSSGDLVRDSFLKMLSKYSPVNISVSKLISAFFDLIISSSAKELDTLGIEITTLEEVVISDRAEDSFNFELLKIKKLLLSKLSFFKSLLSLFDVVLENENDVIAEDLNYLENLSNRIERVKADINALQDAVVHLQEAYSAYLDLKLNKSMKIFTVLTSVFFPLTVVTSWYGMNFKYMPELNFRYGYLYVIIFSALIVLALFLIGKKKHWF